LPQVVLSVPIPDRLRPPPLPPPFSEIALLRVVLEHQVGDRVQRNVFHVGAPNFPLSDDQNIALNELFTTWWTVGTFSGPPPAVFQSSRAAMVRIAKYFIPQDIPFSQLLIDYVDVFLLGAGDFPPLPANSTVAVSWGTESAGAGGRGRTYFPGLADIVVDPDNRNQIRADQQLPLTNAFHQLNLALLQLAIDRAEFWSHLLYHRNPRPTGQLFEGHADQIVTTYMKDIVLDSQYRRLHKRHGPRK